MKKLEKTKLKHEEILFEYQKSGYQIHEVIGEMWAWAFIHAPSMVETYTDGSQPAPYEHLAKQYLQESFMQTALLEIKEAIENKDSDPELVQFLISTIVDQTLEGDSGKS